MRVSLRLPYKALSTNSLYMGVKRKTKAYRIYTEDISKFLQLNFPEPKPLEGNLLMTIEVGFSSPLADLSNSLKGLEDLLAQHFMFNDRYIVEIKAEKYLVDKGSEYMQVTLEITDKNIDRRIKRGRKRKETA